MHAGRLIGGGIGVAGVVVATLAGLHGVAPNPEALPPAPPDAALAGTVYYLERIALPPRSTVEVVLEDITIADRPAVAIARTTFSPQDRLPIPFRLRYAAERVEPNHRYGVRAAILWANGARMFASTDRYAALDGVTPNEGMAILVRRVNEADATADAARRVLFECGDNVFFAVSTGADQATLFVPKFLGNDSIVLPQTEAASGARYAAGDTVFWTKGNVATLQIGGRTFIDCMAARSRR
jgi:putative lipoprotein